VLATTILLASFEIKWEKVVKSGKN